MPRRSDLTPRDLKEFLPNIFLVERVGESPPRMRARLIGTGLTGMAGDITGMMLDEAMPPDHMARWTESFSLVLDGRQPMRFVGRVHLPGREHLDAENLIVPLADSNDEPAFAMGLCRYTPRRTQDEKSWEDQIALIPDAIL